MKCYFTCLDIVDGNETMESLLGLRVLRNYKYLAVNRGRNCEIFFYSPTYCIKLETHFLEPAIAPISNDREQAGDPVST